MSDSKKNFSRVESERALIATLFTREDAREDVFGGGDSGLTVNHFVTRILGVAYVALEAMFLEGDVVVLHALHRRIAETGYVISEKENETLKEVCAAVDAVSDYRGCIQLLRAAHAARAVSALAEEVSRKTAEAVSEEEIDSSLAATTERIEAYREMIGGRRKTGALSITDFLGRSIDRLDALSQRDDDSPVTGVPTGLAGLDAMTTGLHEEELIVVGARPSVGKTAVLTRFGHAAAEYCRNQGKGVVCLYSAEMGGVSLVERFASMIGRINLQAFRTGKLTDDEWQRYVDATEAMKMLGDSLMICDEATISPNFIRADLRRLKRKFGKIGMIGIDYLQLMASDRAHENRANEVGAISRHLKRIAKEEQCPVVALSQLNRGVELRANKRPMMSDLRESGGVEQDADAVYLLYRDEYYNPDTKEPGIMEINVGKQRNGPTGTVKVAFEKSYSTVTSLTGF